MTQERQGSVWKLTLAYDGSQFSGWQVQPGLHTVQGALAAALARITGEQVLPQGSGRTDAGVHALAQVASVALHAPIPPENLARALNHVLPASVRVTAAEPAAPGFHARHSALRKTYEYRVFRNPLCPPWLAPYVCAYDFRLDLDALHRAAAHFVGTHDFRSFQAQQPDAASRQAANSAALASETVAPSTVRTIHTSQWEQPDPERLVYRVTGSGFLHHMVRNLVGTCFSAGRGLIDPDSVPAILKARERTAAGPTAPASGLWLHSVEYPSASETVLREERSGEISMRQSSLPD